jgi:hypothetical protein
MKDSGPVSNLKLIYLKMYAADLLLDQFLKQPIL